MRALALQMGLASTLETQRMLEKDSEPLVTAAHALQRDGRDSLDIACMFSNTAAVFAMRHGLSHGGFMRLCSLIWQKTEGQMRLVEGLGDSLGDGGARLGGDA